MTEQNLEPWVKELQQKETLRHHEKIRDLQIDYHRQVEDENTRYQHTMHDIQRMAEGVFPPGVCSNCKQSYSAFHQWQDYEQCPRCGADLHKEPAIDGQEATDLAAAMAAIGCDCRGKIAESAPNGLAPVEHPDYCPLSYRSGKE